MFEKKRVKASVSIPLYIVALLLFISGAFLMPPQKDSRSERVIGVQTEVEAPVNALSVKRVIDGDTIELSDGRKVRYIGINTPEKKDPYYEEAKNENERLLSGKQIEFEIDIQKTDKYGRLLAYVYADGVMVNEVLVQEGFAVVETVPPNVRYQKSFLAAQEFARFNCVGIWNGLCNNVNGSCLVIDEIHPDPPGDDNKNKNEEWIRIKNDCAGQLSLENFLLKDSSASNRYVFKSILLQPADIVTVHSGCGEDSKTDVYWQCPEPRSSIWNNDGDEAYLYNPAGLLVDYFAY